MSNDYAYYQDIAAEVEVPKDGIISRTVHNDEDTKVVMFGFDTGQELSEHTASMPAIIHILRGEAKLTLGADEHQAVAGTWAYMPANMAHSVWAKTPLVMLLIMSKAAKRAAQRG